MVNYLYDIGSVEARHQQFVDNKVSHASAVRRLLKPRS
jgi:malonyl-CoA decarboxylase